MAEQAKDIRTIWNGCELGYLVRNRVPLVILADAKWIFTDEFSRN